MTPMLVYTAVVWRRATGVARGVFLVGVHTSGRDQRRLSVRSGERVMTMVVRNLTSRGLAVC